MDPLKEAFSKIKSDISFLRQESVALGQELAVLRQELARLQDQTSQTHNVVVGSQQTNRPTQIQTDNQENMALEGPYLQNNDISIGNKGVPTDRPTDQQTNRQTQNLAIDKQKDPISEFRKANEILSQLDEVKREIRRTFKSLTSQEMNVFATIYELENSGYDEITYKKVSDMLNLSESSIREYVNKILKKGVSITKIKHNNKTIHLKIAQNIKNIASLPTILQLREL